MNGIDEKLVEAGKLVGRFTPAVMNGNIPEGADIYRLAVLVRDVLEWILALAHDPEKEKSPDRPKAGSPGGRD